MNSSVDGIVKILLSFDSVTIITHIRPDGDTLGSAYALKYALESVGKTVNVVCESEISPRYRFITQGRKNINGQCIGAVVCVDVASPSMVGGSYEEYARKADVVIDHHSSNMGYGKYNLIDPQSAATGEIVLRIIQKFSEIDSRIAECLYTAIATDTGCFVYANATDNTHLAAAYLIQSGADVAKLNKLLFRTKSHACFEIERRAFDSLEYFYDNSITCMKIELDWIKELHANEDDLEGISSIPAQIEGTKASATFRQTDKDTYKLSVRTNGEIDAAAVCKYFGGGGHKMAAGCTMTGDYKDLKKIMADKLFEDLSK